MKKILALVLVLILALGLVACGGGGTESAGGGDKPAAESNGATQPAAQSGDDSGFIQRQIAQSFQFIHSITILKFIVCRAGYFVRKPLEFILPL